MNIIIEDIAVEYIAENGGAAFVRYTKQGWCHSGTVDVAVIDLGEPDGDPEDYQPFNVKHITLYLPRKLVQQSEEVEISLSTLLRWKKLMLERY